MSQYLGIAGGAIGAIIGSAVGGPGGAMAGMRWGFTIGALVEGFLARPPTIGDAHFSGASYGTGLNRCIGTGRVDCPTIWALPLANGTYLQNNGAPGKGKTSGDQYSASFMIHVAETAFTFDDGTQIEWPLMVNRVWMADMIVWQNAAAEKIQAWSSSVTYAFGMYATGSDNNAYYSLGNNNLNHDPTTDNQSNPVWWKLAQVIDTNVSMTVHPQPGESSFTMAADHAQTGSAGDTNTSAYRGCTNLFFDNLNLYQIGNQMPQAASCEVSFGAPAWSNLIGYQIGSFASDGNGNVYQALDAFTASSVPQLSNSVSVTSGASSTTQEVGSTTGLSAGQAVYFASSGLSRTIESITDGTHLVLTEALTTTTDELLIPATQTGTDDWLYRPPPTWADFLALECRSAGLAGPSAETPLAWESTDYDFCQAAIIPPVTWSSGGTYGYGAQVTGSDGNYYFSLTDTNTGNDPTTTQGVWWEPGMFPMPMTGVISNQRMTAEQSISAIMAVNAFDMIQVDGKLKVVKRGRDPVMTIPEGDLSAALGNEDLPDAIEAAFLNDPLELHSQLEVRFQVLEELYRVGGEKAVRNTTLSHNPSSIDTGICASRDQIAKSAGYMLDTEWVELGGDFKIYLPASGENGNAYQQLCGTDVITLPWLGTTSRFKVVRTEISDINLIEVTCCIDQAELMRRTEIGSSGTVATQQTSYGTWPLPIPFILANPPQDFSDDLANHNGFYVFAGQPYSQLTADTEGPFDIPSAYGPPPATATVYYSTTPPLDTFLLTTSAPLTGGSFTFTINGETTSSLAYNATAAEIQAAIQAIDSYYDFYPFSNVVCMGGPISTYRVVIWGFSTTPTVTVNPTGITGGTLSWSENDSNQSWINASPSALPAPGPIYLGNSVFGTTNMDSTGILGTTGATAGQYEDTNYVHGQMSFQSITDPLVDIDKTQAFDGTTHAGLQPGIIGNEIIGVVNGSLDSGTIFGSPYYTGNAYIGPGLYRGLRQSSMTGHYEGEGWAVCSAIANLYKVVVSETLVGEVVWVQVLAAGQSFGDAYQQPIQITNNAKSFAPALAAATPPSAVNLAASSYSGASQTLNFSVEHTAQPGSPQTYNWSHSTDGGSTWSTPVSGGTSYTPPSFSSGSMMVQCTAITQATVPKSASPVSSSNVTYAAPSAGSLIAGFKNDVFTASSGQTAFTLSYAPNVGSDVLFWNGVKGVNGVNYTISGLTMTLSAAANSGDTIDVTYAHS